MYDSIENLYSLYYNDLYRFVKKLCPDTQLADDIVQNTFLEAMKSIEGFQQKSTVKTWLFGICKHQLYRQLRKSKLHFQLDELAEAEHASSIDYTDKMLAEQILTDVQSLDPPLDEIMSLRLVQGLSFKEIGLRVHRSENYCRVNFFRMKEKLRREYGDEIL